MKKFTKMPLWKKRLYLYSGLAAAFFIVPFISFSWMDGSSFTRTPTKTEPQGYDAGASHQMCIEAIRASVNNPSTLKIHGFSGYGTNVDAGGTRRITQTFSAKNAFGLQKTYDAYCEISPQGEFAFHVQEQGG